MVLRMVWLAILSTLVLLPAALAQQNGTRYVTFTPEDGGPTIYLDDARKPALYTGDFGDCNGGSSINVSRWDVAYYKDNMTINFHVLGNSALINETVMLYIGVYAYGARRYEQVFNPCGSSIYSMCPIKAGVPISAAASIPVSKSDVAGIPEIALNIPDFEGQAILRIFSNRTQQAIGCYSAVITNGATFSQPAGLGSVLGIFALVALIASFATAAYGEAVPTMRLHYAHSLSVGVVFAVFQHIFFTGALSMNWPSVLVAWWSNFAWSAGMIYTKSIQDSIGRLLGNNIGSTLWVGAAPSGTRQESVGGGFDLHQLYGRSTSAAFDAQAQAISERIYKRAPGPLSKEGIAQKVFERAIARRDGAVDTSSLAKWYGGPVQDGLPIPGNYSGFAGTLAQENLRISNAFLTGFIWLLILILTLIGTIAIFKGILELFARRKWMPQTRLGFFRQNWLRYVGAIILRTCYIAWFMIMFLTIFQFTFQSPASVKAIAAIVFVIFLVGMLGLAAYACVYEEKKNAGDADPYNERKGFFAKLFHRKRVAPVAIERQAQRAESKSSLKPFWQRGSSRTGMDAPPATRYSIHDDEDYIMKFGWLASRFRRTRWWFFTFWLFYEFVRACFYAGASGYPLVQVFGLLVVEIFAFVFVLWAKPFEGRRLNVLVVYCLGFSKVTTVALSAAFDIQFNLDRIITTVIGIVIIVIQGILMIITCIAIIVGAVTSYMSVSRNTEDFKPKKYIPLRERYFDHLDRAVNDLPPAPKAAPEPKVKKVKEVEAEPIEPSFEMKNMRRVAKIEDNDADEIAAVEDSRTSLGQRPFVSYTDSRPTSRTNSGLGRARTGSAGSVSMGHGSLPFGARPHKTSWSTRDFDSWNKEERDVVQTPVDMTRDVLEDIVSPRAAHVRTSSRGSSHSRQRGLRSQSSGDDVRRTRPRGDSHGSSGRITPVEQEGRQGKMPMLTPAQESEEFQSYFDHFQKRQHA